MEYVKIGNVKIEKTAALAPMASVADKAYRTLCKRFGAALVVGEMASSKGLFYSDKKTAKLLTVSDEERPMAVQLFGDDLYYLAKAISVCETYNPDIIDINMGCPVPKVAGNGSGSALMKNPKLVEDIVKAVVKEANVPITVKLLEYSNELNKSLYLLSKISLYICSYGFDILYLTSLSIYVLISAIILHISKASSYFSSIIIYKN